MFPGRISFYLIYHSVGEDTTKSMTDTVKAADNLDTYMNREQKY